MGIVPTVAIKSVFAMLGVVLSSASLDAQGGGPDQPAGVDRTIHKKLQETISVKDFGAKGDGVADDTAAIQAAINYAYGSTLSPHGIKYYSNNTLWFPPGKYKTSATLQFTKLQGAKIIGAGRFTATIQNITPGSAVIATNGSGFSHFESLQLIGTGKLFDLTWDGKAGGAALQSNTFQDMFFNGGTIGVDIGADGFMGSENLFLNCFWINQTVAGLKTENYNALQNTVVGGNFQDESVGIYMAAGTVSVYGTGFQQSALWDIVQRNSARDAIVIDGARTESANFYSGTNGMTATFHGISQLSATAGTFISMSGEVAIDGCNSLNGQIKGNMVGSIRTATFGRKDWLEPDLSRKSLTLSQIMSPSSFIEDAVVNKGGYSYPTERTFIPLSPNGNGSIIIRAGTRVQKVTVVVDGAAPNGTVNVGDDADATRYFAAFPLTGSSSVSSVIEQLYVADTHIRFAVTRGTGIVGAVAVDFQRVALSSPW